METSRTEQCIPLDCVLFLVWWNFTLFEIIQLGKWIIPCPLYPCWMCHLPVSRIVGVSCKMACHEIPVLVFKHPLLYLAMVPTVVLAIWRSEEKLKDSSLEWWKGGICSHRWEISAGVVPPVATIRCPMGSVGEYPLGTRPTLGCS